MKICALCNKELVIDKYFARKATCPHCAGDLHICMNCRFYSVTAHNKCLEPKSEFQRSRDKANFCDYFIFHEGPSVPNTSKEKADALKKLDDLFRK